jgi:hypothetical protein
MSSIKLSPKHGVNPMMLQCPLCAGDAGIALMGRLPDDAEAPREGCLPQFGPCQKCEEMMKHGFLLIVCKDGSDGKNPYRTGQQFVITNEAAERMGVAMAKGAAFIEESVARKLGLYDLKPTMGDSDGKV